MKPTTTIRDQLAAYLTQQDMSIHQFSIQSGINSGTLSRVIGDRQPIAMNHLERITQGMKLQEDHFFSLYVDECFHHSAPTWRRLRPFLMRSAALGRLDCIEQVVQNLLDNLIYAPMLFEVAEGLYQQGQWQAAALLYKNVSASEKYQNSERLALCQYRLFRIALGDDQSINSREAILFECYIDRLDEADQLDGIIDLLNVYYSLQQWPKVEELAQKMLRLATLRYNLHRQSNRKQDNGKMPQRPLYLYILNAYLFLSSICMEYGDYKSAIERVPLYMDGSWIQEDNEEVQRTLAQFREWGTANIYLYRVLDGQLEVLADYVEYISTQPDEIFTAVYNIIKSANQYDWNVDHILERFSAYIPYRTYRSKLCEYNQQIMADKHARFLAELAVYYLHNKRNEEFSFVLQSMETSAKINNESIAITCVELFEQYRYAAGEEELDRYKLLIRTARNAKAKKIHQAPSFM
ncbi:transcriptional regulator [Paenibacillus sp. P32E]|uniref:transcriptional regulator n=1 Tax=Paenibacillus sp. P32E TaxID=1349434 RepID=UPI00095EB1DA|nr:transcriptional regulator [Paenibacillus sp. P32E]OKP92752.1 transcriptional regulator [Paenibacillus sp. P32E]